MDITPSALEAEFTLSTAATRLDFLSRRDSGATALGTVVADRDDDRDSWSAIGAPDTSLDTAEALELLALGEVIARKAHNSRLIGLRAALRGGADWERIGRALDRTPAQAWETYLALVDEDLDGEAAEAARALAGARPAGARPADAPAPASPAPASPEHGDRRRSWVGRRHEAGVAGLWPRSDDRGSPR